jgi:hypothetical protein
VQLTTALSLINSIKPLIRDIHPDIIHRSAETFTKVHPFRSRVAIHERKCRFFRLTDSRAFGPEGENNRRLARGRGFTHKVIHRIIPQFGA